MMAFHDMVWIFFRITNCVILIFLFRHVFKNYFYQDFKEQIAEQFDFLIKLRERVLAIGRAKKDIDKTITHDEQEVQRLMNNISQWRTSVEQAQQRKQQERDMSVTAMHQRQTQQENNYQQTLAKRVIISEAFIRAQQQLQYTYEQDENRAYTFIKQGLGKGMSHE
jgi:hypothetical protein